MFQPKPTSFANYSCSSPYYANPNALSTASYIVAPTPLGHGAGKSGASGLGAVGGTNSGSGNFGLGLVSGNNASLFAAHTFQAASTAEAASFLSSSSSTTIPATTAAANNHRQNNKPSSLQQQLPQQQLQQSQPQQQQHQQQQHQRQQVQQPRTDNIFDSLRSQTSPSSHFSIGTPPQSLGMTSPIKMEQPHDLAQQEAAAREYEPQLEGPLVGEKTSSHAITEEYAKSDPTYVAKTMALPQKYSHYRPLQGDGNCGWRAIGFGYFESLIRHGDVGQVQAELSRWTSLKNYMHTAGGIDVELMEDFITPTSTLLSDILQALTTGQDAMAILTSRFNNPDTAEPLIYHLRMLAAAWLKGNIVQYQPFVVGEVDNYCEQWIMPVRREMDHLGLVLLHDALLQPIGIVLEVAYLDRSEGEEVNIHRMPDEANGQDPALLGPIIRLLYRPGHYDLLYREPAVATSPSPASPPVVSTSLQINHMDSFNPQTESFKTHNGMQNYGLDMSTLAMIPGFDSMASGSMSNSSLANGTSAGPLSTSISSTYSSPSTTTSTSFTPSPQPPWVAPMYPDAYSRYPRQSLSPPIPGPQGPLASSREHVLRFSRYNLLPDAVENLYNPEPGFTTNTFRNSHFNTAHFQNPHFQPEEYKPEDDELPPMRPEKRRR